MILRRTGSLLPPALPVCEESPLRLADPARGVSARSTVAAGRASFVGGDTEKSSALSSVADMKEAAWETSRLPSSSFMLLPWSPATIAPLAMLIA